MGQQHSNKEGTANSKRMRKHLCLANDLILVEKSPD